MASPRAYMKSVAFLLLVLTTLMLPFQNCNESRKSEEQVLASGGNGSGYDGKTFVHISEQVCSDGKGFDSSIVGANGAFYLTRDNCVDIPAGSQAKVYVQINPANPTQLTYADRLYLEQLIQVLSFKTTTAGGYFSSGHLYAVRSGKLEFEGSYIGRFDEAGAPLWVKRPIVTGLQEQHVSRPLADGGAILMIRYLETLQSPEQSWIARLSPSGALMWKRNVSVSGSIIRFNEMEIDPSGGIFLAGTVLRTDKSQIAAFARLDLNGAVINARTFDFSGESRAKLQFSASGVLYLTGKIGTTPFIARLNADGTLAWSKMYTGWVEAALVFTDDGAMMVKARISRPVPGTGLNETFERYAELNPDGSIKQAVKLSDESWSRYQQGKLYRSGDGALYTTLPLAADSFTVLRLRRDLSVEWAYTVPLTDQLTFFGFERLSDGSLAALFTKKSSLIPFTTDFLVPYDVAKIPSNCAACSQVSAQTIRADEVISVSDGPASKALTGLSASATALEPMTDLILRLPFYPSF